MMTAHEALEQYRKALTQHQHAVASTEAVLHEAERRRANEDREHARQLVKAHEPWAIINSYMPGLPVHGRESHAGLLAVLVRGAADDYAVYEAIVTAPDFVREGWNEAVRRGLNRWVADNGLKCSYARARTYFPGLPRHGYRD